MRTYNKVGYPGHWKTGEQLGVIFMKVLNGACISSLSDKLNMINIYAPTWGNYYSAYISIILFL